MRVSLGRIDVFPIKSLDGAKVDEASITPGGILEHDRVYAMVDGQGKYLNGKRDPRVHQLRSGFDPGFREVRFSGPGCGHGIQFALAELGPISRWLGEYFGMTITLKRESTAGFPDDREAYGPTVVSESSLREVASWYPGLGVEGVRRRFRSNLELSGEQAPPFWEDCLYGAPGELRPFQVGAAQFFGHNPCQRCAVPTRDPKTGEVLSGFQTEFMSKRRQTLPPWANSTRFNHFYRFAVNTSIRPTESGKRLRVGDSVAVTVPDVA